MEIRPRINLLLSPKNTLSDGGFLIMTMKISEKEQKYMNNKIIQFWRFIVLNLKILKAVDHSKRS